MRNPFRKLAVGVAAAALLLAGCSSTDGGGNGGGDTGGGDDPFRVVAFTTGNQTPVGAWWVKAVEAKADELGWDLTMIQGDFDPQKMTPAVESAIGQGADAIFNGYTDAAGISSIVTTAKDAGIPIFAMDAGVEPTDAYALNITTNQQGMVDQTVGAISDALGGLEGKTVMVLTHDPHAGIRMRARLAMDDLQAAGATIAGGDLQQIASPATGREEALNFVADYMTANPGELDAVWAGWDDAALGAMQAVTEADGDAVVTGVDAVGEAVDAVLDRGPMIATVEQPWPSILDDVIEAMLAYQEDGTLPDTNFLDVPTILVDINNAADITPSDQLG